MRTKVMKVQVSWLPFLSKNFEFDAYLFAKIHLESLELAVLCFLHNGLLPFPTVHKIEGLQSVLGSQVFKYF